MSTTLNVRAGQFARRRLFEAEPDESFPVASLSARQVAFAFCSYDECADVNVEREIGCRVHTRAVVLGLAKLMVAGEVLAELSPKGVLFVRLSPKGVLVPLGWSSVPHWCGQRPDAVDWARAEVDRQVARADVDRWEARV